MDSPQPKHTATASTTEPLLQQALTNFRTSCSAFISNLSSSLHHHSPHFSLVEPNLTSLQTHLQFSLSNIHINATRALQAHFSNSLFFSAKSPLWARITLPNQARCESMKPPNCRAMSNEAIEERLAGVPVYALSNSAGEFVLVSGVKSSKSLGLFCFKEADAEALLEQMRLMDPGMRDSSKVVAVALNKVFQLKLNGVAFRLIPEASQIKNALREMEKAGSSEEAFPGIPVFQSQSLILRSQNKSYRPVFFRKEDLENSLLRASRQQNRLNPVLRQGNVEVAVLEEIIKGMKDGSCSKWDDVVFIPPGFDVSTDPTRLHHD
ncbi:hypothetical protein Nepgr_009895 [Nepenthes gracilis]|uniref:Protein TIC 22-like, chloroplastic n=1 Tax=Nepenthes gracilis TaxID=150966 RepID=A0AAD3XKT6_NEPGR|nr:hypothetical protein Nepgr_009895 [Nepenthes gracilis]